MAVTCSPILYSIGEKLSGLGSGKSVTLQDNGGDNLTLTANASFTLATKLAQGTKYAVTVLTQPAGQSCTVMAGTGTVVYANITSVQVACR